MKDIPNGITRRGARFYKVFVITRLKIMASQSKDAGNTINQTVSRGKASSHYLLKKRKKYLGWVSAPVPLWDRHWGHGQSHLLLLSLFTLGKEKTPALFI